MLFSVSNGCTNINGVSEASGVIIEDSGIEVYNEEPKNATIIIPPIINPIRLVFSYSLECNDKLDSNELFIYGSQIKEEAVEYVFHGKYRLPKTGTAKFVRTDYYPYNQRTKLVFFTGKACYLVLSQLGSTEDGAEELKVIASSTFNNNYLFFLLILIPVALIIGFIVYKRKN